MAVREGGRPAVTHYRVLERFRAHTYLQVKLETGRTHQIRLHLSHMKYPIVGDPVYGGRFAQPRGATPELIATLRAFKRQALHAATLGFDHPRTGKRWLCTVRCRADFAQLLAALRDDAEAASAWRASGVRGEHRLARGRLAGAARRTRALHACAAAARAPRPTPRSTWAIMSAMTRGGGGESPALAAAAGLPAEPAWLAQVHGVRVADLDALEDLRPPARRRSPPTRRSPAAGAGVRDSHRRLSARVLAAESGDLGGGGACRLARPAAGRASRHGRGHAGPARSATSLMAWLGPAIGPAALRGGRGGARGAACRATRRRSAAFEPNARGRFMADLALLARRRLRPRESTASMAAANAPIPRGPLSSRTGATGSPAGRPR